MPTLWIDRFKASDFYTVTLKHGTNPLLDILPSDGALLLQPIAIQTASEWGPTTGQPGDSMLGKLVTKFTPISGFNWFSTQLSYSGTAPLTINLNIGFLAVRDARSEVVIPATKLMQWPLPPENGGPGGQMQPPVEPLKINSCCSVITKFFGAGPVFVPIDTNVEFSHTYDSKGAPISAQVALQLQTRQAMSANEVARWFKT